MIKWNEVKRGQFLALHCDGTQTLHNEKPTLERVYKAIKCGCIDNVILTHKNDSADLIMLVDDEGLYRIPRVENVQANALLKELSDGKWPHTLYGDVAIVHDTDF